MTLVMKVFEEDCVGCGACVEACPNGAIDLVDGKAHIDMQRCTQCSTCEEVCPNEAIRAVDKTYEIAPTKIPTVKVSKPVPLSSANSNRVATPWIGAALSFLGSEVAPRLLDALVGAFERRQMLSSSLPMGQKPSASPRRRVVSQDTARGRRTVRHRQRYGRFRKFGRG